MSEHVLPHTTPKTEPFWAALKAHRIDIQRCDAFGQCRRGKKIQCPQASQRWMSSRCAFSAAQNGSVFGVV